MLRQLRLCSHTRPTPPPVQQVSPACAAASCRSQLADRKARGIQCTAPISLGRQGQAASTVVCAKRGRAEPEPDPEPELFEEDQFDDYEEEDEAGEFEKQLRADPMTGRLMGLDPGDEAEEHEEYEEAEDEGALDEAAEADRDGAAADDVGEPSTSYPDPPDRVYPAADIFGEAAFFDTALWLAANYPSTLVSGVQSNPHLVIPGDIFVLHPWLLEGDDTESIMVAVEKGAAVVVAPQLPQDAEGNSPLDPLEDLLPDGVPLVRMEDTMEAGSRLAVAFYDAPSREMVMVGVLGCAGKTTTAWLIRGILEELGQTVGLMSNIEHAIAEDRLDEDGYLWEALEEDPSADRESSVPFKLIPYAGKYQQDYGERLPGVNTHRILAGMRDRGAGVAVTEIGAQGLVLGSYDYMELNVAVVTGLGGPAGGSADREVEGGREWVGGLATEWLKAKLLDSSTQALVLNLDDPGAPALLQALDNAVPVVTYGINAKDANVVAESIKSNIWETEIIVRTPGGRLQIITNLLGSHNASNVLAAVATGVALKAPLTSIVAGVEAVEVPGRSEVIDEGQEFSVVVDAARSPEALGAMLDALRQGGAKQIFTVFGCPGNEDSSIRSRMGTVAHNKSDYVIVTNDSPRLEDPARIVSDIVAGWPDDMVSRYNAYAYFPFQDQGRTPLWFEPYLQKAQRDNKRYIMEDRYSAIRAAIGTAGPEDVILLAGRGHVDWVHHAAEDGGVLTGWLDDRVEVRNALSKLKYLEQIPDFDRSTLPWGTRIENLMETMLVEPAPGRKLGAGLIDE